jgi:hypothetical protein
MMSERHEDGEWTMDDGRAAARRQHLLHPPSSIFHPRLFLILVALLITCASAHAAPTQEEFFKSMQTNVDNAADGSGVVLWLIGGAIALVVLLFVVGNRQQRHVTKPRALNHSRKLLREVARQAQLKAWELKELKAAADDGLCTSPLTLLICPSLLGRAITEPAPGAKANRRALAQIARKLST